MSVIMKRIIKKTITGLFAILTFIPLIVFGYIYLISNLLFGVIQMFMAKLYDWAGYPNVALLYLEILNDKRKGNEK